MIRMGRISRGWKLTKLSLRVIRKDKEILLLPVISGIVTIALLASFVLGIFFSVGFEGVAEGSGTVAGIVMLAAFYLAAYFVAIFFNAAIIGCATIRLTGGDPTLKDGLRIAMDNIGRILAWAVVAATVGVIIKAIQQRVGIIGRIIMGALGVAWTLVTYFVVPVLIYEKLGPIQSVRRSAGLFKKTWGEMIVGNLGLGLIFFLAGLLGIVFIAIGAVLGGGVGLIAGLVVAIVYWLILAVIKTAAEAVLVAALYNYATTGQVPAGLEGVHFASPWSK
jgi:hypothetical protein